MRICKLEPAARKKGRWLVHLENETVLLVTEAEMVSFSLYTGMELSEQALSELTAAAGLSSLRARAAGMLAARSMSRSELVRRLMEKGGEAARAEAVADWLEGLGLLNDAAYADSVVRHYANKGYGIYKIKSELSRRGVPEALWEDALAELADPADAINAIIRTRLREKNDRREVKRCFDALARRGYAWSDITDALRRFRAESEDDWETSL